MILFEIYTYMYMTSSYTRSLHNYRKYYPYSEELCEVQFRTMTCACHNKQDAFIYPDRKDARSITSVARCQKSREF